jgi:hypothetical protein
MLPMFSIVPGISSGTRCAATRNSARAAIALRPVRAGFAACAARPWHVATKLPVPLRERTRSPLAGRLEDQRK